MNEIQLTKIPVSLIKILDHKIREALKKLVLPFEKKEDGKFFVSAAIIKEMIYNLNSSLEGWFENNGFPMDNQWKFPESCCKLC